MRGIDLIESLLFLAFIVFGGWYLANSRASIRLPPDQAAISVAKRYEINTNGTFVARHAVSSTNAAEANRIYIVSRDNLDIARVTLKPFRKVGWQEAIYQRIEPASKERKEP